MAWAPESLNQQAWGVFGSRVPTEKYCFSAPSTVNVLSAVIACGDSWRLSQSSLGHYSVLNPLLTWSIFKPFFCLLDHLKPYIFEIVKATYIENISLNVSFGVFPPSLFWKAADSFSRLHWWVREFFRFNKMFKILTKESFSLSSPLIIWVFWESDTLHVHISHKSLGAVPGLWHQHQVAGWASSLYHLQGGPQLPPKNWSQRQALAKETWHSKQDA